MTLARRLDKVEASLSPTQLVLRWLAEAHASGSMDAYVGSLLDEDPPPAPLDRLCREAASGARNANRGKRDETRAASVDAALLGTVFRYVLVLRINVTTHELLDREALIDDALVARVALVTSGAKLDSSSRDLVWLGKLRDLLLSGVSELTAAGEARTLVERRYLEGHSALFPDLAAAWDEQAKDTASIAELAVGLAEIHGVGPAAPPGPEALPARTAELVADLVEPAKAEALEMLGESGRALGTASAWVRTRLARPERQPSEA